MVKVIKNSEVAWFYRDRYTDCKISCVFSYRNGTGKNWSVSKEMALNPSVSLKEWMVEKISVRKAINEQV